MQTRRDQLQAYRFQNRRALAALVTGDAHVVEPPMRRLTAMTISGIMIAILVTVVFALLGKFSPDTGDSWKEAGAVIIDNDTGATYLYDAGKNTLHPVVNYTSAVLAISGNAKPHTVHVDPGDIKSAKRGYLVGIRDLPLALPGASGLLSGPWSVCSSLSTDKNTAQVSARTVVRADSTAGSRPVGTNSALLVRGVGSGTTYVLVNHERLEVTPQIAATLQLSTSALPVTTAFLDGVPAGPALRVPAITGLNTTSARASGLPVGQLVKESGGGTAVALRDGFLPLNNAVQIALLQTLPVNTRQPTVSSTVVSSTLSQADGQQLEAAFGRLPAQIDPPPAAAQSAAGVCAVYRNATPTFGLLAGSTQSSGLSNVAQSAVSRGGKADEVDVPSDAAALVRSDDGSKTLFVVDPSGKRFALGSGAQGKIGYGNATPQTLARQLLSLVPPGPAMDSAAASRPPVR